MVVDTSAIVANEPDEVWWRLGLSKWLR